MACVIWKDNKMSAVCLKGFAQGKNIVHITFYDKKDIEELINRTAEGEFKIQQSQESKGNNIDKVVDFYDRHDNAEHKNKFI